LKEDKGLYRSIYELQLRPQEEAWQAVGHLNGEAAVGRRSHTGEALPEVRRG
jgi:hypothetical protein